MAVLVKPLLLRVKEFGIASFLILVLVGTLFHHVSALSSDEKKIRSHSSNGKETWGYVKVRPDAFMFWWLYMNEHGVNKPLIMWLQGGPGGSSTGFGNFAEIGPQTVELKARETTWLKEANLLFVDNPVGSGFSYVTKDQAYTTNVTGLLHVVLFNYFSLEIGLI